MKTSGNAIIGSWVVNQDEEVEDDLWILVPSTRGE